MSSSKFQTILLSAGSIAALLIAGIQIYDWFIRPSDELVGIIDYGEFEFPQGVKDSVASVMDLTHPEYEKSKKELVSRIDKHIDEDYSEYVEEAIELYFTLYLRSSVPNELVGSYGQFEGYWNAKIINEGSTTLKEVTLSLPDTAYAQISREGSDMKSEPQQSVIRIGTMLPQEVVEVYAWTTSNISYLDEDELKLVHSDGAGNLRVLSKVGPFWAWLDRYWGLILVQLGLLFLFVSWAVPQFKKDMAKLKSNKDAE